MLSDTTYENFLDELRAFESGWDRDRYESGRIVDSQLDQWAGGTVQEFFPQYSSWGDLTEAEWRAMSYTSTNSLGFVGYQFGEALLIDLGYYDDDVFFGNGAAANTWDGVWTGKNGVNSLAEFKTEAAQEIAIREAFGHNLKIIEEGLGFQGESLDDYIGETRTYVDNGQEVTVVLTLTGIMAAAHLRGAFGTLNLLQNGSVSVDEFGTSILRYIEQFGGFDAPNVLEAIAFFDDRKTGDEGIGAPTSAPTGDPTSAPTDGDAPSTGDSTGGIDRGSATHVIDWAWGRNEIASDFDPGTDTIFIAWFSADQIEVTETAEGVVFSIPDNNQSLTLADVKLADLDLARITALDETTRAELASLISTDTSGNIDDGHDDQEGGHDHESDPNHDHDDGHGDLMGIMTTITLSSTNQNIEDFDAAQDMVHIEEGITAERLQIFEESGDALGFAARQTS